MTNLKTNLIALITLLAFSLISINTSAQLHVAKPDGDVGIGTDAPTSKLDVDGQIGIRGVLWQNGNGSNATIQVGKNRTAHGNAFVDLCPWDGGQGWVGRFLTFKAETRLEHRGGGDFKIRNNHVDSYMRFFSRASTEAITIAPNGNVGILMNGANPSYKFHVNGGAAKPGGGSWANASDKRLKKNIEAYNMGLRDVLKLNPVYYNYNGKGGITDTETKYVGLIAQDFKKVVPNAVSKFKYTPLISQGEGNPYKKGKTEEYLAIDPSQITFMLVNGMKEQQTRIETQKAELETLKDEMAELKANGIITNPTANEISVLLEGTGAEKALLAQNTPNPFTTSTRIEYFIPTDSRNARMSFRDMNGKEIKRVNIKYDGIGAIELSAKDLAAGIYSYVLYINGSIEASKKMILKQ